MKNYIRIVIILLVLSSCMKAKHADLVIHNASIYSIDEEMSVYEAMAIVDGKIVEMGPEREILNAYSAYRFINAKKKEVYPGLHDAHGHIMSYAKQLLVCDLVATTSYQAMLTRLEKFAQKENPTVIEARGWDQSIWGDSTLPNNQLLDERFPDIPVVCTRIDGHAMLANTKALELAGITSQTKIEGGKIIVENNECTGLLLDMAIELVKEKLPKPDNKTLKKAILKVQEELIAYGITNVHEAGLMMDEFKLFDELATEKKLKLSVYAMLFPNQESFDFIEKNGIYNNGNLTVRSFKIIGDGSLGSRGACLLHSYSDANTTGFLTTSIFDIRTTAGFAKKHNYQMNTHCIGDSTNRILLNVIDTLWSVNDDHRWRIEHAQVINQTDFALFNKSNAIPSVQPTHAVSDMRWAEKRLGTKRLNGAYAYQTILNERQMIVFGTDFPVEKTNPFLTLHAAMNRKNGENEPDNGFLPNQAISFENCIKAMTFWAAMARFEENTSGSLEKNKDATFVILDNPMQRDAIYQPNYAWKTFHKGELIFGME